MHVIDKAFEKAVEVLRMNVTDRGFTACSVKHDADPRSNYRSIWARDSAITALWSLPLRDKELTECGKQSIKTILNAQTRGGHLPNYVEVESGKPEYGGVGNISGIDGAMWMVIAAAQMAHTTGDLEIAQEYLPRLRKTMIWLRAHDSNNCGLLEVPEASDWTDLFPRSYNVLYDEVLWYRSNICYAEILKMNQQPCARFFNRAAHIHRILNRQFWPTPETVSDNIATFADTQFSLGRTHYLIAQITPFGFSWRCDSFANILACMFGVLNEHRQQQLYTFLRQICLDKPAPIRVLYPPVRPGEPDWRDYFLVNLQNLPNHYHNGGVWPFVGGLWVRFLGRCGRMSHAKEAMKALAELNRDGIEFEWEFNEWAHGETGRPMGKAYQAWSAASYVAAYLDLQGETTLDWPEFDPHTWKQSPEVAEAAEDMEETRDGYRGEQPNPFD